MEGRRGAKEGSLFILLISFFIYKFIYWPSVPGGLLGHFFPVNE